MVSPMQALPVNGQRQLGLETFDVCFIGRQVLQHKNKCSHTGPHLLDSAV